MKKILSKLLQARISFAEGRIPMTGYNEAQGFSFFTLKDIVPAKNNIFKELGLIDVINFTDTTATLTLVDTESEEKIDFVAPFPKNLNSLQPNQMQAIGSAETYSRRYLYLTMLDIVEPDNIDGEKNKNNGENEGENEDDKKDNREVVNGLIDDSDQTVKTTIPTAPTVSTPTAPTPVQQSQPQPQPQQTPEALPFKMNDSVAFIKSKLTDEFISNFVMPIGRHKGEKACTLESRVWEWYATTYSGSNNIVRAVCAVLMESYTG